ncbi:3-hydroxyacyl-ACP dehydratase FabZ family protein [Streptomyces longisporoflavus]|uniref:3-hydroxyacyl-ACP dehydratase FabZ family protein n=1 Tax=Streptomyces longisporoflavus TaxID=28044 RepID=A0ABW7QVF3_9ACTN
MNTPADTAPPPPTNTAETAGQVRIRYHPHFDRPVRLGPGEEATAVRNIPNTLDVFATHFPRKPVLPGVLLLESMAALAALVCEEHDTFAPASWRLSGVRGVGFRHFIGPGDQVEIRVRRTGHRGRSADFSASARVDDRTVATARTLTMTTGEAT